MFAFVIDSLTSLCPQDGGSDALWAVWHCDLHAGAAAAVRSLAERLLLWAQQDTAAAPATLPPPHAAARSVPGSW